MKITVVSSSNNVRVVGEESANTHGEVLQNSDCEI